MDKFFWKIVCILEENNCIEKEDKEAYVYALKTFLIYISNVLLSLIIGFALKVPEYCAVFLVAFILLRQDAGGYHAPGWILCYFLSCTTLILSLLWIKISVQNKLFITVVSALVSYVLIMKYAPLEDDNRPLDDVEKKVIRRRARYIVTLEMVSGAVLFVVNEKIAYGIWSAVVWCGVGYLAWFVKKIAKGNKHGNG